MGKDPAIFGFILVMLGLFMISIIIQFAATVRLAKWLCHHHPKIWRELGRPGTTFFKGEEDNGYFSRGNALQRMFKSMPLQEYDRKLAKDEGAQRYLRQHRLAGRWSVVFFVLFGFGILIGHARHETRAGNPPEKSETRRP